VIDIGLGNTLKIAGAGTVTTAVSGQTVTITGAAPQGITFVGDDSTGTRISDNETIKIAGAGTITTSMSGDTLTITGTGGSSIGNLQVNSTTLSPITTNDNITLDANGTGQVRLGTTGTSETVVTGYLQANAISSDVDNFNNRSKIQLGSAASDENSVMISTRGSTVGGLRLTDVGGLDTEIINTSAGLKLRTGSNNSNITITPHGTGSIVLDGLNWPQADGSANYVLKTNGSGQLSWTAQTVDTNTTYGISAETSTGGVNLRLTGSDASTDDVKLAEGSNITLTRTDANTITIASTGGGGSATGMTFVGDDSTGTLISDGETLKIAGGTGITTAMSGDTLTITATGGGGGGSTGDLSIIGSTISSASNGDLRLTTAGTGKVVIGPDDINTTTWPDTYDLAGNSTNSRHAGPFMFYSDLAQGYRTSQRLNHNQRLSVFKLDTGSTQVNNGNHTFRITDQIYYDIKGTEHGTSITNAYSQGPIAGDHQTIIYNTSGGTLNGGSAAAAQGFVQVAQGHGGDVTYNNITGVIAGANVNGNTGSEVTRVTNAHGFLMNGISGGGTGTNGTNRIITNRYAFRGTDMSSSSALATNDYSFVTDYHASRAKPGAIERFREYGTVATHSASGTYTVNAENNLHIVTLGANITSFTMSNFPAVTSQSAAVTLLLVQDGTGGRTVTFTAGASETFKFANGTNTSTVTAANDIQVVYVFSRYNGTSTTYYWTLGPAFS
jgi:hypothetical protein